MCSHVTTYGGGEGGGMGEREQRLSGRNGRDGAGVESEGWGRGSRGGMEGVGRGSRGKWEGWEQWGEEQHSSSWSMGIQRQTLRKFKPTRETLKSDGLVHCSV